MTHINDAWRSGFVRRWHQNPDMADCNDINAAHCGRMAVLCIQIFPEHSHELLKAIAAHDNGEDIAGDLSSPIKKLIPSAAEALWDIEKQALAARGLDYSLDEDDLLKLIFLDRLDAFKMMLRHKPALAEQTDWIKAGQALEDMAETLGVYEAFIREAWIDY